MKTQIFIIALILALLLLSSCREITIKTTIHEDGSFTRVLTIQSDDSASVYTRDLPYPIDVSWSQEYSYDTANSEKPHTLVYSKTYSNSKELNTEISSDTGWRKNLVRNVAIEKHFGFFYSYLSFSETIKAANPFTAIDYHDYLSESDLKLLIGKKLLQTEKDSAQFNKAEEAVEQFLAEAISTEIISELEIGIRKLNLPSLNPDEVIKFKDSINCNVEDFDFEKISSFIDYYANWTDNPEVEKLKELSPPLFQEMDKKMDLFMDILMMESYIQVIELPGLLTETNSINPVGNQVSWKIEPASFLFEDFSMTAESRIINYWAFILTGIVLILLITVLAIKAFGKSK